MKSKVTLQDGTLLDEASGTFTVGAPGIASASPPATAPLLPPSPAKPPISWPVIGGAIAGVIVVGLVIFPAG